MEAERPMQNDEREPRDTTNDPQDADAVEADEFETASWPSRDTPSGAAPSDVPATEPPPEAEAYDAAAQPVEEPQPHEPPPPDIEAHTPPDVSQQAEAGAAVPAHSVPATEPGESTRCPRCGTENRPGIAFCRNCGQRLVAAGAATTVARPAPPEGTQACPRCGTHNRAGTPFCQNCGANLRGAPEGYVPPAVADETAPPAAAAEPGRALLGPIVLVIGAIFLAVAWALPFAGDASLYGRAFGSDGYGIAFWNGYDGLAGLAEQAYFGFAAPAPILIALLAVLAVAGVARRAPGPGQLIGLVIALLWAIGLIALFVVVEVLGAGGGDLLDILRVLTPGGIIFMLASLIVVIGVLTRFGRG
jgi:hypothetical protein